MSDTSKILGCHLQHRPKLPEIARRCVPVARWLANYRGSQLEQLLYDRCGCDEGEVSHKFGKTLSRSSWPMASRIGWRGPRPTAIRNSRARNKDSWHDRYTMPCHHDDSSIRRS